MLFTRRGIYSWKAMDKIETNTDELSLRVFCQKGVFQNNNNKDESWNYLSRQLLVDAITRDVILSRLGQIFYSSLM